MRLAVAAAQDMVAGRPVETAALVASLRQFIREVLELDPVPATLAIPKQGPLRPSGSGKGGAGLGERAGRGDGGKVAGGAEGLGLAGGAGLGAVHAHAAQAEPDDSASH